MKLSEQEVALLIGQSTQTQVLSLIYSSDGAYLREEVPMNNWAVQVIKEHRQNAE